MKKNHRLNKSEHILATIKNNKKICSPVVNVFYMKNDFSIWKIAIIASKKRFNKAVTRNKVKRQVKAIIRELSINLKSNNIVLVVKEEWLNKSFSENKMILNKLLTKLSKGVG